MKLSNEQAKNLEQSVREAASWLCRTRPALRHDAEQEIWAGIIGKAHQDDAFLAQKPAYIVRAGAWAAGAWLRRVGLDETREPALLDAPAGEGETPLGELLASSRAQQQDPLEYVLPRLVIERICQKLAGDEVALTWTLGTLMGYRGKEIARQLFVSEMAVSRGKARAGAALQSEQ